MASYQPICALTCGFVDRECPPLTVVFQHLAAWPRHDREFVYGRCPIEHPDGARGRSPAQPKLDPIAQSLPTLVGEMSTEPVQPRHSESLELPVEELLRRARPLPPHDAMVIEDLSEEEGAAFLAALEA